MAKSERFVKLILIMTLPFLQACGNLDAGINSLFGSSKAEEITEIQITQSPSIINTDNQDNIQISGSCPTGATKVIINTGTSSSEVTCTGNHFDTSIDMTSIADGTVNLQITSDNNVQTTISITKDTTPPSSTTIDIANSASNTADPTPDLAFTATDAAQMYITNTAGCNSGGSWESFSTSKMSWALGTPDGVNFVYVKFKDQYDNESACINDVIMHASGLYLSVNSPIQNQNVEEFTVVTGQCTANLAIQMTYPAGLSGPASVTCSAGGEFNFNLSITGAVGTKQFTATQTDTLGNTKAVSRTVNYQYGFRIAGNGFNTIPKVVKYDNFTQKIYVGGSFSTYNSVSAPYLVRLNLDGTLDTSFNIGTGFNGEIYSLDINTSNGDVYVGGAFTSFNSVTTNRIVRLNTDGSADSAFNIGTGFNDAVLTLKFVPALNAVFTGGWFTSYKGVGKNRILKLLDTGAEDTTFAISNGADADVTQIEYDATNNKVYAVGWFNSYRSTSRNKVVRINSDGTVDTGFTSPFQTNNNCSTIAVKTSTQQVFVGCSWARISGIQVNMVKLSSTGTLMADFATANDADSDVMSIQYEQNLDKVFIAGYFSAIGSLNSYYFAKMNANGTSDSTFYTPDYIPSSGYLSGVTLVPSLNAYIVWGSFNTYGAVNRKQIVLLDYNGSLK